VGENVEFNPPWCPKGIQLRAYEVTNLYWCHAVTA